MSFISVPQQHRGYLIAIVIAVLVLLGLQYRLWYGEYGLKNLVVIKQQVINQERINADQANVNSILLADVQDLKSGLSGIEEHARLDLGLIKPGETFFQLSNAPLVYSSQASEPIDTSVESVDAVPELDKTGGVAPAEAKKD